ncbi:phytanoyl-CoA dioxygenase family protein [Brevundimonas sp.]|uniref:phytanoyl-CoA dioxygenase family protein n=1 Tax=Brevundimonas sp. TaxID=1871086 RepID=UPI002ED87827
MQADDLNIPAHGAALFRAVLSERDIADLLNRLGDELQSRPGRRLLFDTPTTDLLAATGKIGSLAAGLLGPGARPVRAVLFDKSQAMNWIVAWHQDRTIAVRERRDTPDFGPWSVKDGIVHVAPPISVLDQMVTLRVHLDPCADDNAPLIVALGSHRLGKVAADNVEALANQNSIYACHADAGDVWAYATPILHSSAKSLSDRRRRVLQLDYSAQELPNGLEWLGVARTDT